MPLSDQDRRRLDAIEQALVSDDPDLAAAFTSPRRVPVKAVLDGLLIVLGAVVLVAGLVTTHAYVITGGLIAVAGAAVIATGAGRLARYLRR